MKTTKRELFGITVLEVACRTQVDYWALPGYIVRDGRAYFKDVWDREYGLAYYHLLEECAGDGRNK